MTKEVDSPVEENICRPTSRQECVDVPKIVSISAPRTVETPKCSKVEGVECKTVEVSVPKKQCTSEMKPVCSIMPFEECYPVEKEVMI